MPKTTLAFAVFLSFALGIGFAWLALKPEPTREHAAPERSPPMLGETRPVRAPPEDEAREAAPAASESPSPMPAGELVADGDHARFTLTEAGSTTRGGQALSIPRQSIRLPSEAGEPARPQWIWCEPGMNGLDADECGLVARAKFPHQRFADGARVLRVDVSGLQALREVGGIRFEGLPARDSGKESRLTERSPSESSAEPSFGAAQTAALSEATSATSSIATISPATVFDFCRDGIEKGLGLDGQSGRFRVSCGNYPWSREAGGVDTNAEDASIPPGKEVANYAAPTCADQGDGQGCSEIIDCTGDGVGDSRLTAASVDVSACRYDGEIAKLNATADIMLALDNTEPGGEVVLPKIEFKPTIYSLSGCGRKTDGTLNRCAVLRYPQDQHYQRYVQLVKNVKLRGEEVDWDGPEQPQDPALGPPRRGVTLGINHGSAAFPNDPNGDDHPIHVGPITLGLGGVSVSTCTPLTPTDPRCEVLGGGGPSSDQHGRMASSHWGRASRILGQATNPDVLCIDNAEATSGICSGDPRIQCSGDSECASLGRGTCEGFADHFLATNTHGARLLVEDAGCDYSEETCTDRSQYVHTPINDDSTGTCAGGDGRRLNFSALDAPGPPLGTSSPAFPWWPPRPDSPALALDTSNFYNLDGGLENVTIEVESFFGRAHPSPEVQCTATTDPACDLTHRILYFANSYGTWARRFAIYNGSPEGGFLIDGNGAAVQGGVESFRVANMRLGGGVDMAIELRDGFWDENNCQNRGLIAQYTVPMRIIRQEFRHNYSCSLISIGGARGTRIQDIVMEGNIGGVGITATVGSDITIEHVRAIGNRQAFMTLNPGNDEIGEILVRDVYAFGGFNYSTLANEGRALINFSTSSGTRTGRISGPVVFDNVHWTLNDEDFGPGTNACLVYFDSMASGFVTDDMHRVSIRNSSIRGVRAGSLSEDDLAIACVADMDAVNNAKRSDDLGIWSFPGPPVMENNFVQGVAWVDQAHAARNGTGLQCSRNPGPGEFGVGAQVRILDDIGANRCAGGSVLTGGGTATSVCMCSDDGTQAVWRALGSSGTLNVVNRNDATGPGLPCSPNPETPEGCISGAPGHLLFWQDDVNPERSRLYHHRGTSPGASGWVTLQSAIGNLAISGNLIATATTGASFSQPAGAYLMSSASTWEFQQTGGSPELCFEGPDFQRCSIQLHATMYQNAGLGGDRRGQLAIGARLGGGVGDGDQIPLSVTNLNLPAVGIEAFSTTELLVNLSEGVCVAPLVDQEDGADVVVESLSMTLDCRGTL